MKIQELKSRDEVLNMIGAKDFRSLKADQLISFVSQLPNMDKEVALKCIEQFPNFVEAQLGALKHLHDGCVEAIQENKESNNKVLETYKLVIEQLSIKLQNPNLSTEEILELSKEMNNILTKMSEVDNRHKQMIIHGMNMLGGIALTFIVASAGILGLNIQAKK